MKKKHRTGRIVAGLLLLTACCAGTLITVSALGGGLSLPGFGTAPQGGSTSGSTFSHAAGRAEGVTYGALQKPEDAVREGALILVNHTAAYRGAAAPDPVSVYTAKNSAYYVKDKNVQLSRAVMEPLNRMLADFKSATGTGDIMLISGVRNYDEQRQVYERDLAKTGLSTSRLVAKPGHSEHQTGLAVDFGLYQGGREYDGTGVYNWVNQNCVKYGFVVRYAPDKAALTQIDSEPWHFRYVGTPHAELMQSKNYCLEEYLNFLKGYSYEGEHLRVYGSDSKAYELYYVRAASGVSQVMVPTNRPYRFSGNNVDGFVVTVEL